MLADHQSSHADGHCVNARCGEGHPCLWASTAARLEAASLAPFHQKMTSLLDPRSWQVPTPAFSGRTPPRTASGIASHPHRRTGPRVQGTVMITSSSAALQAGRRIS